ncbi:MAG: hypothetical protein ACLUFV_06680 [Acutalibacteraceae bacterium]
MLYSLRRRSRAAVQGLSAFLDHFADIYDSYSAGPDASFSPAARTACG